MQEETVLKPSMLLMLRNFAFAAIGVVAGYFMVQTEEIAIVILGAGFLIGWPFVLLLPLFSGMPARGPCPVCGGPIETMSGREFNLMCRGCTFYLDARDGKLRRTDFDRVEAQPHFCAPTPWEDIQ